MNPLHYPDLERCKKLTEIGFPNTENYMAEEKNTYIGQDWKLVITDSLYEGDYNSFRNPYRCPSVMEMLDVIPWAIERNDGPRFFTLDKHSPIDNEEDHYDVGYMDETDTLLYSHTNTLPNALADLIFWLHENKYIKF